LADFAPQTGEKVKLDPEALDEVRVSRPVL